MLSVYVKLFGDKQTWA